MLPIDVTFVRDVQHFVTGGSQRNVLDLELAGGQRGGLPPAGRDRVEVHPTRPLPREDDPVARAPKDVAG